MKTSSAAAIAAMLWMGLSAEATQAAELKVLAANGIQSVLEELAPVFEQASGHKLILAFASGGATAQRAQAGEAFDVVIAPQPGIDSLVQSGKVAAGRTSAVASTGISVAVRAGAAKPDISSPGALKASLLAAKSITYLNPADGGASGIHFAGVLDRLGIAQEMKARTTLAPGIGALGTSVASGQAEIGVLQYQLLFKMPGVEVVGPLPGDLQQTTIFSAATLASSSQTEAAGAFVRFLRGPQGAAAIRAKGMDSPGS
jgi:molybdate transport system substrate-binding protein